MSIIKKGIELIVFSNLWIALSASGFTFNTYLLLDQELNYQVILLVFFSTFSIYNLQRLVKHSFQKKNHSFRHQWIFRNVKILTLLVVLSSLIAIFLFFKIYTFKNFIFLLPFSLVSILYSVTLFSRNKSLRNLPLIKIFLIAITWAVTSVVLPFLETGLVFDLSVVNLFVFNFLFMLAVTIPFDIRDVKFDGKETLTLPQYLGVEKSISLALWLLVVCLVISIFSFFTIGQVLPLVVSFVLVSKSKKEQKELFYSGFIDSLMLLFPLLNFLFY